MITMTKKVGKVTILGKDCDIPSNSKTRIAYMIQRGKSVFANPSRKGVDGTKEEVIAKFIKYFDAELFDNTSDIHVQFHKYLKDLVSGKDVHLRCGCKPAACHGDHIKLRLEQALRREVAFPEDDGITHINVYSKGKTKLGRFLSNFTLCPVKIEGLGKFASIEGLWHYMSSQTGDVAYRSLYGSEAKTFKSKLPKQDSLKVDDLEFKKIIKTAIMQKLLSNKDFRVELFTNPLPLFHYYTDPTKEVVVDPIKHVWVIEFIESLRPKPLTQKQLEQIESFKQNSICPEIEML